MNDFSIVRLLTFLVITLVLVFISRQYQKGVRPNVPFLVGSVLWYAGYLVMIYYWFPSDWKWYYEENDFWTWQLAIVTALLFISTVIGMLRSPSDPDLEITTGKTEEVHHDTKTKDKSTETHEKEEHAGEHAHGNNVWGLIFNTIMVLILVILVAKVFELGLFEKEVEETTEIVSPFAPSIFSITAGHDTWTRFSDNPDFFLDHYSATFCSANDKSFYVVLDNDEPILIQSGTYIPNIRDDVRELWYASAAPGEEVVITTTCTPKGSGTCNK